ncbi:hypothetical protein [Treponema sp.]|uniref:hypothetical protein n=1 Tax=Treponema sp. TaxID=166 RepID=UPI00298DF6A7|nr:hypothetical protein [Treponema sp.]
MDKFVSSTLKEKAGLVIGAIVTAAVGGLNLFERILPVSFSFFMFCGIPLFIFQRSMFYKYKIENNTLIVKKFFKTQVYDFDQIDKIFLPANTYERFFALIFSHETVKILTDKNIALLIKYFFENNIEEIYKRKFPELDASKRFVYKNVIYPSKYKRLKLFIIFLICFFICLHLYFERGYDWQVYFISAFVLLSSIISLIAVLLSYRTPKPSEHENDYIDKDGVHLFDAEIPFSQISEIYKTCSIWGTSKFHIKTKNNTDYVMPGYFINGDVLYEMYMMRRISEAKKSESSE